MSNHVLKLVPTSWKARLLTLIRVFKETQTRVYRDYHAGRSAAGKPPIRA